MEHYLERSVETSRVCHARARSELGNGELGTEYPIRFDSPSTANERASRGMRVKERKGPEASRS
jgi:hypothetical protein